MIHRNQVSAASEIPTVQYANGKTMARPLDGAGRFQPYIGFHLQCGRDATIDDLLAQIGLPVIEIKHQRPGTVELVRHWNLGETITLFPITAGPVARTVAASVRHDAHQRTIEAGIGIRWGTQESSRMAIRGFLGLLVQHQHIQPVQFTTRGRMTDMLLQALIDHGRVCEQADRIIHRDQHPEPVMFHELALPLGPGEEEWWGSHHAIAVTPFRSLHPKTVTPDYIRSIWRPRSVDEAAHTEWPAVVEWAQRYATVA